MKEQNPLIWGDGWYAIQHDANDCWYLAPKKFFDELGHCPDGWEWDIPEGMDDEEFDEYVDEYGCEPEIPDEFRYCAEVCISCTDEDLSIEEQKEILKNSGFIVDNIPAWWYDRGKE